MVGQLVNNEMADIIYSLIKRYPSTIENGVIYSKIPITVLLELTKTAAKPQEPIADSPFTEVSGIYILPKVLDIYNDIEQCQRDVERYFELISEEWKTLGKNHQYSDEMRISVNKNRLPSLNRKLYHHLQKETDALEKELVNKNLDYIKAL